MVSVKALWVLPEEGLGTHPSSALDEAPWIILGRSLLYGHGWRPSLPPRPPQTPAIFTLKAIRRKH